MDGSKMKVLHLLSGGGIGGIEMLCRDIAELSSERNEFCFLYSGGAIADDMEGNHAIVYRLYASNMAIRLLKLLLLVRRNKYDVVIVHHEGIGIYLFYIILTCIFRKCRYIKYLHCSYEEKYFYRGIKWKDKLNYLVLKTAISRSSLLIAVSEFVKNTYLEEFKCDSDKMKVIYNGIRLEQQSEFIYKTVQENEPVRLLYIGRLVEVKGVRLLLHAMKKLVDAGENIELELLGDGPQREEYEQLTQKLGLGDKVRFRGYQLEKESYYDSTQIFVYPSIWQEAFGISIVEAMAHGMLCVASRSGGIPEIIDHEVNGFLFENENEEELIRVLQKAIRVCRDGSWQVYVNNACEKVGRFDIRNMIDALKSCEGDIVSGRK